LSFERTGALLCIPDRRDYLSALVSDHASADRANRILRESLRGLNITRWKERQVITAAATTDGSTIMSRQGKLLDIACMIAKPYQTGYYALPVFVKADVPWCPFYGRMERQRIRVALKFRKTANNHLLSGKEIHRLGGGR